jgi:hypothetical protein
MCDAILFNFLFSLFLFKIYKTIILPVVLYGHKTWALTLREEHILRVLFETRVPRRISGATEQGSHVMWVPITRVLRLQMEDIAS